MRDGIRLYSSIYVPQDSSQAYPVMLNRTPYRAGPYGTFAYPQTLGPSAGFFREGFIFVYQDVRGLGRSEGQFIHMRPEHIGDTAPSAVDESTDTYDTIDWLVHNVRGNNGRVGLWGISYPGFYAAAGMIGAHPALRAVSPQAPIADLFVGDDLHHNGAFFLQDAFSFFVHFGQSGTGLPTKRIESIDFESADAYRFFLDLGALPNVNSRYFHGSISFWNDLMAHGTYDEFWRRFATRAPQRTFQSCLGPGNMGAGPGGRGSRWGTFPSDQAPPHISRTR